MTSIEPHLPGTEPTPPELARARNNLRRDHIRHRLTNAAGRTARLSETMWSAGPERLAELERCADHIEAVLEQTDRALEDMRSTT